MTTLKVLLMAAEPDGDHDARVVDAFSLAYDPRFYPIVEDAQLQLVTGDSPSPRRSTIRQQSRTDLPVVRASWDASLPYGN